MSSSFKDKILWRKRCGDWCIIEPTLKAECKTIIHNSDERNVKHTLRSVPWSLNCYSSESTSEVSMVMTLKKCTWGFLKKKNWFCTFLKSTHRAKRIAWIRFRARCRTCPCSSLWRCAGGRLKWGRGSARLSSGS
jgi:hypothetical protein